MSKKMLQTALALAAANLFAYKDIYDVGVHVQQSDTKPLPVFKSRPKKEYYFVIKGKKILATSYKDAIKKYNHKYK